MNTIYTQTQKIPKLRFPEFSDEWDKVNFYDVIEKVLDFRGRTPLKLGMSWDGDIPSLSALNVKMGYIDFNLDPHKGSEALYNRWMIHGNLRKNDILLTMEAPLGNVALVPDDKKYILSQRVVALKINKNVSNLFLFQLMCSSDFQKKIENLSTGSTAKGINQRSLKKVTIFKPSLLGEQDKIAEFLTFVDNKIIKVKAKIELLKKYKKGVMQQIFTQKIRFKDENGEDFPDWEAKKLDDIATIKTGNLNVQDATENGEYTFFDRSEEIKKYKEFTFDNEALIYAGEGSEFIPRYFKGKYGLHQRSYSIFNVKGVSIKYLYYWMLTQNNHFLRMAVGSTVKSLRMDCFQKCRVVIPFIEEQQRIADFLTSMDEKIEFEERMLAEAKKFKKFLLQNMFI